MSELQKFPRLFHIGTQKAGSTYLYNLLKQHPQVSLSELTEINFFSRDFNKGFDYYRDLFQESGERIDMTPKYFMLASTVAPRIKEYADKYLEQNPKFLLILRNPIDYLNSHYAMQKIQNPKLSVDDKNKYSLVEYIKKNPGYLNRAKYFEILNIWLKYFDLNNFKIICFEDFIKNKEKTLREILDFFALEDMELRGENISKNKLLKFNFLHKARDIINKHKIIKKYLKNSKIFAFIFDKFLTKNSKNILSNEDGQKIKKMLEGDVNSLKKMLGRNFNKWEDFR